MSPEVLAPDVRGMQKHQCWFPVLGLAVPDGPCGLSPLLRCQKVYKWGIKVTGFFLTLKKKKKKSIEMQENTFLRY